MKTIYQLNYYPITMEKGEHKIKVNGFSFGTSGGLNLGYSCFMIPVSCVNSIIPWNKIIEKYYVLKNTENKKNTEEDIYNVTAVYMSSGCCSSQISRETSVNVNTYTADELYDELCDIFQDSKILKTIKDEKKFAKFLCEKKYVGSDYICGCGVLLIIGKDSYMSAPCYSDAKELQGKFFCDDLFKEYVKSLKIIEDSDEDSDYVGTA